MRLDNHRVVFLMHWMNHRMLPGFNEWEMVGVIDYAISVTRPLTAL